MNIIKYFTSMRVLSSIIIIILVYISISITKKLIYKNLNIIENKHKKTYLTIILHILKYTYIFVGIVIVLKINGIDITSILAGVGIISIITGLALQDALKDIIMGINIVFDNFYRVGDVIKLDNIEGQVIGFNLKTTKIKDIDNNNIYVITNRNIDKSLLISKQFDINISLKYEDNLKDIEKCINKIIELSNENKKITNIKYLGIDKFDTSSINYKIRIFCDPINKPELKRYINNIIKQELNNANLEIPYTQIDIHNK